MSTPMYEQYLTAITGAQNTEEAGALAVELHELLEIANARTAAFAGQIGTGSIVQVRPDAKRVKVPAGTVGIVFWLGEGAYNAAKRRIGIVDREAVVHWASVEHVLPVTDAPAELVKALRKARRLQKAAYRTERALTHP